MRKLVNTVLAGALGLSMIAGVSAEDTAEYTNEGTASVNVAVNDKGSVTPLITQAPNFGTVPYSVTAQDLTSTDPAGALIIEVTYDRGDSAGWGVTISGSNFTNGEEDPEQFEVTHLTLGTSSVDAEPGEETSVNATLGNGHQMSTPSFEIIDAAENVGSNGIFTITYTGNQLVVPAGTLVDEYTSTLTVTSSEAPE